MPQKKSSSKKSKGGVKWGCLLFVIVLIAAGALLFYNKGAFNIDQIFNRFVKQVEHIEQIKALLPEEKWDASLCFGDEESDYLIREYRSLTSSAKPVKKAETLVLELIKGPKGKGIRTIPENTMLRDIQLDAEGVLSADFSSDFIRLHPGGSTAEIMTVYSLVNTLTLNINEIKRVKFLVEGKKIDTIKGHIDCREPIYPKPALVH